jgi:hypothetical protein
MSHESRGVWQIFGVEVRTFGSFRPGNPFYESMREVSPGDVVFSFADTVIAAIGIAQSYCWGWGLSTRIEFRVR